MSGTFEELQETGVARAVGVGGWIVEDVRR